MWLGQMNQSLSSTFTFLAERHYKRRSAKLLPLHDTGLLRLNMLLHLTREGRLLMSLNVTLHVFFSPDLVTFCLLEHPNNNVGPIFSCEESHVSSKSAHQPRWCALEFSFTLGTKRCWFSSVSSYKLCLCTLFIYEHQYCWNLITNF